MKKILIILILMVVVGSVSFADAPAIYPGINEIRLENGRGQGSFIIFNQGEDVKRYKVTVRDVDNDGEDSELGEYLKVFPRYIEIDPGSNKTVRLLIRDFPEINSGEYRASVSIEEVKSELTETHRNKAVTDGITTKIEYNYVINSAIYGYVGDLYTGVEVEVEKNNGNVISGILTNTGNYSYPLSGRFIGEDGKIILEGALGKIMDKKSLKVNLEVPKDSKVFEIFESNTQKIIYKVQIQG